MDNRKIGVMDSGIGGLTVYNQLQKILPDEQFIYVGDQANLPYGEKSADQVYQLTKRIADYFVQQDVKAMVIACNTATAAAYERLKNELPFPLIGVIQPGAKTALTTSKNHSIGVIATNGTVKSGDYERIIKHAGEFRVISQGCPEFVSLVENGEAGSDHSFEVVAQQLAAFKKTDIDTLILGCTHFPVIGAEISAALPEVKLVDPGVETASQVQEMLTKQDTLTALKKKSSDAFYTTGNPDEFIKVADNFLKAEINAKKIDL